MEQLGIPGEGEAPPHCAGIGLIKGKDDEDEDGGVEEQEAQAHKDPAEGSVASHSTATPSSPSPKRFIRPMHTMTTTIITREMALPRWGL